MNLPPSSPKHGDQPDSPVVEGSPQDADSSRSLVGSPESNINTLLTRLQRAVDAVSESPQSGSECEAENELAVVRLGIASSLFYALRSKHPATAAHGLRVALLCSNWAEQSQLDSEARDRIEVAALLHDIGKIGIPDRILRKPGKLTVDEQLAMDTCPKIGCEILRGCTTDHGLLQIVRYGNRWYESRREGDSPSGDDLPEGARMLAIADAFDAMTTEQVYRPAMSLDRAIAELVSGSGTQFDPKLVREFCRILEANPEVMQGTTVNRWLQQLRPQDSDAFWTGTPAEPPNDVGVRGEVVRRETYFNRKLLGSLKDGVAFTDGEGNIINWNIAMERLTDLPAEAMIGKRWSASAFGMRDANPPDETEETICPLQESGRTGETVRRAMVIENTSGDSIPVHVEVAPVVGEQPGSLGSVIVVHDHSDREDLERRLQKLHNQSKLDALTRVSNRAHLDDTLEFLVNETALGGPTFSLIICDLDHFKSINDTFGHPAGDEALKVFAQLLRAHSRENDLVARYGGEEFLVLAVSCDNASGSKRAEMMRRALETTSIKALGGKSITASFGVTEYQSGDSVETIVARADRALLKAKDNGRNRVVQLGLGKMSEVGGPVEKAGWFDWLSPSEQDHRTHVDILTPVPCDLAIEKLRGFIADHQAEIMEVSENQVTLRVASSASPGGRRRIDQSISFRAKLTLSDAKPDELHGERATPGDHTKVHVEIKPIRSRDRRNRDLKGAVNQLIASFRCYLMGEILNENDS